MNQKRVLLITLCAVLLLVLLTGTAVAAEMVSQELFRVPEGTIINDDLYVSANETYIEGIVQGDLLVSGSYLEINGTVEGDVLFVGLGLMITGDVGGRCARGYGRAGFVWSGGRGSRHLYLGRQWFAFPAGRAQS